MTTKPELENASPPVKAISGRKLACRLRRLHAISRAQLAVDLVSGRIDLNRWTVKQACLLTGASLAKVNAMRRVEAGGSLAKVRRVHSLDQLIDRVVARGGLDRLVDRLDELTKPQTQAAE
jgi:hypothetical protein